MKDILGYEGLYAVTSCGKVWSYRSQKFLTPKVRKRDGRIEVLLSVNNERKTYFVHRLVAETYIPNPLGLPEVNHKDENPAHNYVGNLEWCDRMYNQHYGTAIERMGKSKSKPVYCVELNQEFYGAREAERQTGISHVCIGNCCRGKQKTAGGYHWRYADELLAEATD